MIDSAAQKLAAPVAALLEQGGDSAQAARIAVATWQGMAAALTPIIGPLGFSTLYARAVKLASTERPWLSAVQVPGTDAPAFPALRAVLQQQAAGDAAAGHAALLQAFCGVLSSLIGVALTERLLCTLWDSPSSGTPAEPNQT